MEIFVNLLRGSYAYLLIGQILLVSGLMLAFIWLIIRRTQEAAMTSSDSRSESESVAIPVNQPAAAPIITGIPEAQHAELQKRMSALQEEFDTLKASSSDATALREKVKYLESRLLEYEILQEEIGTLSQLKLENERLKEEVVQMQSETRSSGKPAAPTAPVETARAPAPLPEPPAPTMGSYGESTLAPSPAAAPDLVKAVLVTPNLGLIPEANADANKESVAAGESAAAGLESLLDQIDKLTASSND